MLYDLRQKRTENYDKGFGGKWGIRQLKLHLMGLHGVPAVNDLFDEIQQLIVRSLLSVQQASKGGALNPLTYAAKNNVY